VLFFAKDAIDIDAIRTKLMHNLVIIFIIEYLIELIRHKYKHVCMNIQFIYELNIYIN